MNQDNLYVVTKIEQSKVPGKFTVFAKDADETKMKRRKVSSDVTDPTSFYVGQKVRAMLEDAS